MKGGAQWPAKGEAEAGPEMIGEVQEGEDGREDDNRQQVDDVRKKVHHVGRQEG